MKLPQQLIEEMINRRLESDFSGLLGTNTAFSEQEPLTFEKLEESLSMLRDLKPVAKDVFNYRNRFNWSGLDIHEVPVRIVPRVQVSEDFEWLTDEARERINNRLIELLGYKEQCIIPDDTIYKWKTTYFMRPNTAKQLRYITTQV